MARGAPSSRKRRFRLRWLFGGIIGLTVMFTGAYKLYAYQRQQNTQRVLAAADNAADKQNWRHAAQGYRQYLLRVPSAPDVLSRYAKSLIELAKDDPRVIGRTLETLKKLNRVSPKNLFGIAELAKLYIALREYRPAEQLAQQWVISAPDNPEAHTILAAARHGLGAFDRAVAGLIEAVEQMPQAGTLYPLLVSTYLIDLNDTKLARYWMQRGLQAKPQAPEIHLAAFTFFRHEQDTDSAQKHLDQALALGPRHVPILLAAAHNELDRGHTNISKAYLDRIKAIEPSHRGRLQLLASWARTTNSADSLIKVADEMVERANGIDMNLMARAAELYLDARQSDKAGSCIEIISQARSRSPRVQIWLHALKGTRALLDKKPVEAARAFELVLKLAPNDIKTLELAALAYRQSSNFGAASNMYRRLLLTDEHSAIARHGLAQIDWIHGRRDHLHTWLDSAHPTTDQQHQLHALLSLAADLATTPFATLPQQRQLDIQQQLITYANDVTANSMAAQILADCFALTSFAPACAAWVNEHLQENEFGLILALRYADYLQTNQAESSQQLQQKIISAHPESPRAHLLQLRTMLSKNQSENIRQYIDALHLPPQSMGVLLRGLAAMQRAKGQIDNACVTLRQAIQLNPDDSTATSLLAELTTDRNESLDMANHLRLRLGDDDLQWRIVRAAALLRSNGYEKDLQEAIQLLQYCINQRPRWVTPRIWLGDALALGGELDQSIDIYRSAISEQPELGEGPVAARLVTSLNKLGRFIEADAVLSDLTRSNPDEPAVLRLRTKYYVRTQDISAAIETAERLLAASGHDPAWAATTASLHWRSGNNERAESIARDYLQRHPQEPALWWSLTRALVAQGKEETAISSLQQAARTNNHGELYVLLAQLYAGLKQFDKAKASVTKALELEPDNATLLASCAQFWAMHGQPDKQRTLMERALIAGGEDPNSSIRLARLYLSNGSPEDLRRTTDIVQNRLEQAPDDAQALAIKGQLASINRPPDYDAAERWLLKAIASDSTVPQVHHTLASVQIRQGKLSAADKTVSAGLAIDPDDTDLLLASAELAVYRGQHARAIAPLQQVLEKRVDDYTALDLLATSYIALGQRTRAIQFIQQITSKNRPAIGAIVALARLHESMGNVSQAQHFWDQIDSATTKSSAAIQALIRFHARQKNWADMQALVQDRRDAFPQDVDSWIFAAQILGLRQDAPQARSAGMAWLREIAQTYASHSADAIYRLGLCYYQSEQYTDAESHFLQAIGMNPNSAQAVNALAWLYSEHMNKAEQASHLIDRYIGSGGRPNAEMLDTHGVILSKLGQTARAKTVLRKCIRMAGQTSTLTAATYHLGMVLAQAQEVNQVERRYREALILNKRLGGLSEKEKTIIENVLGEEASP